LKFLATPLNSVVMAGV